MKTILKIATLLAILFSLASCNGKEELFLVVDETPITVPAEGGQFSIVVNSNGTWTVAVEDATNHNWCSLTISNDTIIVNVDKNSDTLARSATVKITLGDLAKSVVVNQNPKSVFPREIPFESYTYYNFRPCSGLNFDRKVKIINSKEELQNHSVGCPEISFPDVDFSTHTLLLASGILHHQVLFLEIIYLKQHSAHEYTLNVEIMESGWTAPGEWVIMLVTEKISSNSSVNLNMNYITPW
jgi:hypothetical protein